MKIQSKILTGFALAALVLTGSITFTAFQVSENKEITHQVISNHVPSAQEGLKVLNGVNHSLAALRGWIILGKDKFKSQRATAWTNIDASVSELNKLSSNWAVKENKEKLEQINILMKEFKGHQNEIESIANTIDQRPDLKMLFEDAAPVAGIMSKEITKMIDQELKESATPARKQLLGMMADVRGSLGLGLANIRAYLLSGNIKFKDNYDKFWAKNEKRFTDLQKNSNLLKESQKTAFNKFTEARKIFAPIPPTMFEIRGSDQYDLANYWLGTKAAPAAFKIKEILSALATSQQQLLATDTKEAESMLTSLLSLQWILLGIGLILCSIIGVYLGRAISKPINKVVELTNDMNEEFDSFVQVVDAIASNDLTQNISQSEINSTGIDSKDEIGLLVGSIEKTLASKNKIGNSLNTMTVNLRNTVQKINENTNQLAAAATEIASSAEQMSKGSQNQTNMVTQVSTAVEEITATIVESSNNSTEASNSAESASQTATEGGQIVSDTISGMQKIAEVVTESSESIAKLATSADKIGEIISVIDDIADQTNLLALNAAIEAARAGEQGRGFAVVADEVRKLAERTGKATGEITQMIKGIQDETKEAVGSMEIGISEVKKGSELTDKAGNSLSQIVSISESVMNMIQQIATASTEQTAAAEEIAQNINSISNISIENTKGAEESSEAAVGLSQQAEELKSIVEQFKV